MLTILMHKAHVDGGIKAASAILIITDRGIDEHFSASGGPRLKSAVALLDERDGEHNCQLYCCAESVNANLRLSCQHAPGAFNERGLLSPSGNEQLVPPAVPLHRERREPWRSPHLSPKVLESCKWASTLESCKKASTLESCKKASTLESCRKSVGQRWGGWMLLPLGLLVTTQVEKIHRQGTRQNYKLPLPPRPEESFEPKSFPSHLNAAKESLQTFYDAKTNQKFALFLPKNVKPNRDHAGTHPILVFLHGRGESGGFAVSFAQSLPWLLQNNASFASTFPFIVLAPQCPIHCATENHWTSDTFGATNKLLSRLHHLVGGDQRRIYLAGQSMGGHGALMYASQHPSVFAACIIVCGYTTSPTEASTISHRLLQSGMGISMYHAADDSVIPLEAAEDMAEALKRGMSKVHAVTAPSGGPNIRFIQYRHAPGPPISEFESLSGHGSYEIVFRDSETYAWLLGQVK